MKYNKMLCVMLSVLIIIISGCSTQTVKHDNEKLTIVTTIFPAYDFVREVVGEKAEIHMLIKPGSEVHSYEPTPTDIQLINECDIFVYVGGESDRWIDSVLKTVDNPNMKIVKIMDYANNVEEEYVDGMQIRDGSHGHSHSEDEDHTPDHDSHEHEYDEHVWTSPVNAISIVKGITDSVVKADYDNKEYYIENSIAYQEDLIALHKQFIDIVSNGKRKVLVFGDRFPLLHFVKEYGLEYYAAYPGCAAESEPTITTIAFLIEKVKNEKIPVVFHMELSNERMCDTICEETGAKKAMFSSCHNVTAKQFKEGVTYLDLMAKNLQVLESALN